MAGAWMPGVARVRAAVDGGPLRGGSPRVVWHTTESDPECVPAASAASELERIGRQTHLVWNPHTGGMVQTIPVTRAARALRDRGGTLAPNREGRVCLQVEVVGFAVSPFTEGPLFGLGEILRWLDTWRVPRDWPAGTPGDDPDRGDTELGRARWARGGHFGHSQVPGNAHTDPGPIDILRLTK